jgi:hypothetical protein
MSSDTDTELSRAIQASFARDIRAILERDAALFAVLSQHDFRNIVLSLGVSDDRSAARKRDDAAVLAAIKRSS